MVKYRKQLNRAFGALSDRTRFDMLDRLVDSPDMPLLVLAEPYKMSPPAALKHVRVLEEAKLVTSRKVGRERRYSPNPKGLSELKDWMKKSKLFFEPALDRLVKHIESQKDG